MPCANSGRSALEGSTAGAALACKMGPRPPIMGAAPRAPNWLKKVRRFDLLLGWSGMPPDLVARVHVAGTVAQQLCEMLAAGVVHHRRMTSLADPAVHAPSAPTPARERARALTLWLLPLALL